MGWIHEEKGSERLKRYRHVALSYFYRSWILSLGYIGRSSLEEQYNQRVLPHTGNLGALCCVVQLVMAPVVFCGRVQVVDGNGNNRTTSFRGVVSANTGNLEHRLQVVCDAG